VNADGTLDLLGRGSVCINTAGEKVDPEEGGSPGPSYCGASSRSTRSNALAAAGAWD
jgi:hypothetical protein